MANYTNLPSDYIKFLEFKKSSKYQSKKKLYYGVIRSLNRFSYRYRLAKDFNGINAPNIGSTLNGYVVILKLFLAYSAFEAIKDLKDANIIKSKVASRNHILNNAELAKSLRLNSKLLNSFLTHSRPKNLIEIDLFFNNKNQNLFIVAENIRHLFTHGFLTASAIDTNTKSKRKIYMDLSNLILNYCDNLFSTYLNAIK